MIRLLCSGILTLGALTVAVDIGFAQVTASATEMQVLHRLAEEKYAEGDLQKAAELYLEIAAKGADPQARASAGFTAAWLLDLAGEHARALTALTRSLEIDPDQPFDPSLYNRQFELLYRQALDIAQRERQRQAADQTQQAVVAIEKKDTDRARRLLEHALTLDPGNPAAVYHRALLDLESGALSEALAEFERVVSLTYRQSSSQMSQLRARALSSIGIIYLRQDLVADAEQSFLEAVRADPVEASAWSNLGQLYLAQQSHEQAVPALERAHELRPDDREISRALAGTLELVGRPSQASSLLATHLQRHPDDAELWLQLARIERHRGQHAAAVHALDRVMTADAQNRAGFAAAAAAELARIHLELDDFEAAMSAANQAVGWNRADADAWSVLGEAQMASGQETQAIASLHRAAELDPESVDRQLSLADTLTANQQLTEAEAVYLRALTLDPDSVEAASGLDWVRAEIASQRDIVAGRAQPRKPVPPKRIGLEFAGIDYKDLQLRGALVKNVNKKSPAARAGLRRGDLILWIGDYSVLSDKDFFQYLKRNPPTDRLSIEYLRDGRIFDTELQLR